MEANYEIATRYAQQTETRPKEDAWAVSIIRARGFYYVAEPTPFIKGVLEKVFGPLDYDIPYV